MIHGAFAFYGYGYGTGKVSLYPMDMLYYAKTMPTLPTLLSFIENGKPLRHSIHTQNGSFQARTSVRINGDKIVRWEVVV